MPQRLFALGQQCVNEVVEGAPTTVAPVAFDPRPVVVITLKTDVLALATRTLERAILPSEGMDIGVARANVEEFVKMGKHRHNRESPLVTRSILERIGSFSLRHALPSYKL